MDKVEIPTLCLRHNCRQRLVHLGHPMPLCTRPDLKNTAESETEGLDPLHPPRNETGAGVAILLGQHIPRTNHRRRQSPDGTRHSGPPRWDWPEPPVGRERVRGPGTGDPIRGADRRVTNMWPDPAVLRADTCALPWFLDVARIIQELGYEPFSWRLGCIVIPAESRRPAVKADFPGRSHRSPDQEPGRERGREATDSAPVDIPIQPAPCPLATGPTDLDFSPPEAPLSGFPPFLSPTTSTTPLTQRRVARQHRCSQISYCLYTETTPQSIQTCGPTLP